MTSTPARALIAIGALLLVASTLIFSWFISYQPTARMGLWGIEVCVDGCRSVRWDDTPVGVEVVLAGYLATVASLLGGVLAVASVVRPSPALAMRAAQTLMVALVAMVAFFVVTYLVGGMYGLNPSWGIFAGPISAFGIRYLLRHPR